MQKGNNFTIKGLIIISALIATLVLPSIPLCNLLGSAGFCYPVVYSQPPNSTTTPGESCDPVVYIQPRDITATPGESFSLSVIVNSCYLSIKAIKFKMTYPGSAFTFQNLIYHDLLGTNIYQRGGDNGAGLIDCRIGRGNGNILTPVEGSFVTIYFTVNSGVLPGLYEIWFESHMYNFIDSFENDKPPHCANITVATSSDELHDEPEDMPGDNNEPVGENKTSEEPFCCNCVCGDSNCDGKIDVTDLYAFMQAWGSCESCKDPRYRASIDCDENGIIDILDLGYLSQHWGVYCDCNDSDDSGVENESGPVEPTGSGPVEPTESTICHCRKGDYDRDGDVDTADYTIFESTLGSCYPDTSYKECFDFDDDGLIGLVDLYRMDKVVGTRYCDSDNCTLPWEPWP